MGESCSLHTSYLIGNQIRQKRFNLTGASHHFLNSKFSLRTARFDGEEGSNMGRICTVASEKKVEGKGIIGKIYYTYYVNVIIT